eukprot:scaffold7026_cov65-Phaeocystis_antarctica.AAC.10
MRTLEPDLTTSRSSPPGITAILNDAAARVSSSSGGKSNATRVRCRRPSLVATQPPAHREHTAAAAPSSSSSGASKCGTRSLESSTPSTAHCGSGLCAARMASARFLTSVDASHPAAAISRSCACESSARRSAIRETGSISRPAARSGVRQLGASGEKTDAGQKKKKSALHWQNFKFCQERRSVGAIAAEGRGHGVSICTRAALSCRRSIFAAKEPSLVGARRWRSSNNLAPPSPIFCPNLWFNLVSTPRAASKQHAKHAKPCSTNAWPVAAPASSPTPSESPQASCPAPPI